MGVFSYLFRRAPNSDPGNAQLAAYQRTQAPPRVMITGPGRMVVGCLAPLEGAYISLGYGPQKQSVFPTSLGINDTPGLSPLTRRRSIL